MLRNVLQAGRGVSATGVWLSDYKWLIVSFLIAATIAVFISDNRIAAFGIWKAYFIEPILFFVVFTQNFAKQNAKPCEKKSRALPCAPSIPPALFSVLVALGLSSLLVAIPAIIQKFTAWGIANPFWAAEETRRVVSWYGFPNAVGLYLAPIAVMIAGFTVCTLMKKQDGSLEGWRRKILRLYAPALVFICALAAIVFARSEGAIAGVAAGLIVLIFGLAGGRARRGIGLIGLICLVGFIIALPARQLIMEKATFSDLSGQIRLQQWRETWSMLQDGRVVFGAGLANYQNAVKPYHQEGIFYNFDHDPNFRNNLVFGNAEYKTKHWQPTEIYLYPHNFFLNFWSETGLLGLIIILAILIKFLADYRRVDKEWRPLYLVLISVMIAIAVHGFVDVQYFKNDLSVLFWLILGMGAILTRIAANITNNTEGNKSLHLSI